MVWPSAPRLTLAPLPDVDEYDTVIGKTSPSPSGSVSLAVRSIWTGECLPVDTESSRAMGGTLGAAGFAVGGGAAVGRAVVGGAATRGAVAIAFAIVVVVAAVVVVASGTAPGTPGAAPVT